MLPPRPAAFRTGRAILLLAAASASLATFEAASGLGQASNDTLMVEAWRAFGLAVFTGIFALLAWRPYALPGLLELAIAHKAALAALALTAPDAVTAGTVLAADGLLTIALVAAYVLLGSHRLWFPGGAIQQSQGPRTLWLDTVEPRVVRRRKRVRATSVASRRPGSP